MKSERFKRTKSVMATSAIALVVGALVIGASHLVVGPRSSSPQHVGYELTSSPSTFTITSNIYPSPACSGSTASLYPGVTRCAVFTVQNLLNVPITVQSITTALDASYPAPPTQCAPPTYITLPTFSGSATVGANATVNLPSVPVELLESGSDQSACENFQYHFVYSGGAQYTDSTTTSLASNQSPSTSGQSVTFTAAIAASDPSTDGASPSSGTVTFYSCPTAACASTTQLGTGTVGSNGQATYATSTLPVGTDYIEAVYGGSGTNLTGSTSNVVTQTVTSGSISTTSVLASSANPSTYGSSVTFTDTVSASSGTPGGSVTFYSCTTSACSTKTSLGTGTLNSSGKATLATSTLPVGTTYVEAIYGASGNYGGSTSNVVSQVVNALSTTSVLTSSANPSTYGSSVTFTDTVSGTSGTPGGTVTFYSCTTSACSTKTSLGTGTLNSSGKATLATSTLPVGTTYVEAIYGASGNYGGSTSNVVSQVVNALSTTSVLTSSANPSTYGSSVTFTDTVSASSGTPGGTVTFYSCTTSACSTKTSLGTGTLNSSGKATLATSTLPVGTTYVEAIYGASGNYGGSTSNVVSQVVNALSTTSVLTSSANPSTYGSSVTFTDTVSASSGTPGGTVTFYSCTTSACSTKTSLGTGTLNSSGKATLATSTLPVGTTYVEAIYGASGNYGGSTSNVVSQVVNALSTTSVLTSSANPSTYGSSVTFTDTVSGTSGTPGTVTFYSCTTSACSTKTSLGTGTLNSSGKATYSTSALPVGTTYVEAIYGASGNYGGSTSNVVSQVVNALSTTSVLTSSANPSTYGSSVTFTDTVSGTSGTPGGTVTFYSCTTSACSTKTSLGTGTLNSSGKATYSTSALPVGTTYVEAIYGASGNYATSTSNVVNQVVLSVPSVCASGSYNNVIVGTPVETFLYGTNVNDLIYAFGASYWIDGYAGNDCVDAGDGNNVIFDGNGNDGVVAGNGADTVILGDGNDKVSLGNGSDGVETGDGNDTVTLGNGSQSEIIVGNGTDTVTVGTGSYNEVSLGSGTDTVTIESPGSHDQIEGGSGNETIYLGSGTYNTYSGVKGKTNTCHLPLYNGKAGTAADYHDTITNCTVVSP